jgi:hypothetical protein
MNVFGAPDEFRLWSDRALAKRAAFAAPEVLFHPA